MCNGIDNGYSEGYEPIFSGIDITNSSKFKQVVIISGIDSGKPKLVDALTKLKPGLISPLDIYDENDLTTEIPIEPIQYELPERHSMPIFRESNQKRCAYSTKIK